jgi:hypothetical protein
MRQNEWDQQEVQEKRSCHPEFFYREVVSQTLKTRFPLRIAAGMTEEGQLLKPRGIKS